MKGLHIFYDKRQTVSSNSSFSPSAGKPSKVLNDWKKNKLPIQVHEVTPLNRAELSLAHAPEYIRNVLDLRTANGFGNRNPEVAKSLHWTSGSFASAAKFAVKHQTQAVSLTSGFHHACYNHGGGFCTLNGLVISAQLLRLHGYVNRVGILDLDQHYGNGTDDIIRNLNLNYINHYTLGGKSWSNANAEEFLNKLPEIFDELFRDVDVLFYQAGADSCVDDPLGGVFTQEQMRRRDRIVFEQAKRLNLPLVWNLAGGYQDRFDNVLAIHRATAEEHLRVFEGIEVNTGVEEQYEAKIKRIWDYRNEIDDEVEIEVEESSWEDDINWG